MLGSSSNSMVYSIAPKKGQTDLTSQEARACGAMVVVVKFAERYRNLSQAARAFTQASSARCRRHRHPCLTALSPIFVS